MNRDARNLVPDAPLVICIVAGTNGVGYYRDVKPRPATNAPGGKKAAVQSVETARAATPQQKSPKPRMLAGGLQLLDIKPGSGKEARRGQ